MTCPSVIRKFVRWGEKAGPRGTVTACGGRPTQTALFCSFCCIDGYEEAMAGDDMIGLAVKRETKKLRVFSNPKHHLFFLVSSPSEGEHETSLFNAVLVGGMGFSEPKPAIAEDGKIWFDLVLSREVPENKIYLFADVGLDEMTLDGRYVAQMRITND